MTEQEVHGLAIETGYSTERIRTGSAAATRELPRVDQHATPITRAVLSGPAGERIFEGSEPAILRELDRAVAGLGPGILATWNGSGFDLPYLADRAGSLGVRLGLHLAADRSLRPRGELLPGHRFAYRAAWHARRHLDASRLYRTGRRPLIDVNEIMRTIGLGGRGPSSTHDAHGGSRLGRDAVHAFAANDARLVRCMVEARMPGVARHVDRITLPMPTTSMVPPSVPSPSRRPLRAGLSPAHPAVRAALASGRR